MIALRRRAALLLLPVLVLGGCYAPKPPPAEKIEVHEIDPAKFDSEPPPVCPTCDGRASPARFDSTVGKSMKMNGEAINRPTRDATPAMRIRRPARGQALGQPDRVDTT